MRMTQTTMLRKNLGVYLKRQRQKKNLTQEQLAKRIGWKTGQYVSNIERGVSALPVNRINKYCQLTASDVKTVGRYVTRIYLSEAGM